MPHRILYDNASSDWNEALPMGNGVFGCMSYYREGTLTTAFNHYDVYYAALRRYSKSYQETLKNGKSASSHPSHEEYRRAARETLQTGWDTGTHQAYQRVLWPPKESVSPAPKQNGASHPPTGELELRLAPALALADDFSLSLDIEEATTRLHARAGTQCVELAAVILAQRDACLYRITQRQPGGVSELLLRYPQRRGHEGYTIRLSALDSRTFLCAVSFYAPGDAPPVHGDAQSYPPVCLASVLMLENAEGAVEAPSPGEEENTLRIRLKDGQETLSVVYAVAAGEQNEPLAEKAAAVCRDVLANSQTHLAAHQKHWESYFEKSRIQIPDRFLEKLWFYNLYILACSSGMGGKRAEQASGLNGLWDIRQPTIWGSMWYWDVNIQSTFWPVFTANHLELARVFCDGFLVHLEQAKKRAREYYGMDGYAMDYPHPFYNCIGPWCTQFLWWYFEYTGDLAFLRESAYPVMREQVEFIRQFAGYDARKNELSFFPDVSPEQGPITKNAVITVSCVRFLLKAAAEAGALIGAPAEELSLYGSLLEQLPAYKTDLAGVYGEIWRDSEFAPPQIELRHPSVLMPIFPAGEVDRTSGPELVRIANGTLDFAMDHTELGVFGFGWLSCAASRMGRGDDAIRLLYEKGLDLVLRANGMGAEETDRWLNHCCVCKPPYYYPFMMECVGGTVAGINEMLLQSHGGVIDVFPAVPGKAAPERGARSPRMTGNFARVSYPAWDDCTFHKLLARGGFEVSAARTAGRVTQITLHSRQGGRASVRVPDGWDQPTVRGRDGGIPPQTDCTGGVLSFDTVRDGVYRLCNHPDTPKPIPAPAQQPADDVFFHVGHLSRHVFAGKDRNTDATKLFEGAFRDTYIANQRCRSLPVYLFSFGDGTIPQLPPPETPSPELDALGRFIQISPQDVFTTRLGFGFGSGDALRAVKRDGPDPLRAAFIEGGQAETFRVELPKGRYDLLAVLGERDCASHIRLLGPDGAMVCDKRLAAGAFHSVLLPVFLERDGITQITLDTAPGEVWKLNLLVVRKYGAFM